MLKIVEWKILVVYGIFEWCFESLMEVYFICYILLQFFYFYEVVNSGELNLKFQRKKKFQWNKDLCYVVVFIEKLLGWVFG